MTDPRPRLPLDAAYDPAEIAAAVSAWRAQGLSVGFVPTMGALHAGHIALIHKALSLTDRVVASVFVNPAQFAPGEDFDAYPRTLERDAEKLAEAGCHLVYAPTASAMYPKGFSTTISLTGPAEALESETRPHFFAGVATVVTKLLNQVKPDKAVFGEKDYQQLLVIRRLVDDLDLGVEIVAGETVRESDGLALSSRNAYLSAEERGIAGRLNVILRGFADALKAGAPVFEAEADARKAAEAVFKVVDYIEARDALSLARLPDGPAAGPVRVLAAVRVGKTRLIDNMAV